MDPRVGRILFPLLGVVAFRAEAPSAGKSSFVIVFRLRAIVPLLPELSAAMDSFTPVNAVTAIRTSATTFERLLILKKLGCSLFPAKTATVQLGGTVSNMVVLG